MENSHADLVLENAQVLTCEPGEAAAQAIAIRGERIMRVGTNTDVARLKGPGTTDVDCVGKTLVPGFNDAHCHFFAFVRTLFTLDLSPANVRSIQDIQTAIRRKAESRPAGTWIIGGGYNDFCLAEKRHPTRRDIDEAAPRHPVVLTHRSLHACVLNSLALKLAGISNDTEEPPGGIIDRDLETGEPNGILYEMLGIISGRVPSTVSAAELEWGFRDASRQYLSHGITSIAEATVTNGFEQWSTYRKLKQDGKIASRIYMMAGAGSLAEFQEAGLTTGSGDSQLRLGSIKIVLSEATGRLQPSQAELNQIALRASRVGFQVAIHAVERTTVEAAIKALEYVQTTIEEEPGNSNDWRSRLVGPQGRRPRIEHCSECPPELILRIKELNAIVVSQPPFIYYHGERYLADVAPDAQQWLYPFKSLNANGITTAASSDSPVVGNNPLVGIYAAVTRLAETRQIVLSREGLSPTQALKMYTANGAYASFEEHDKGTLAAGKLADIVMLSHNPLKAAPAQIKDIAVEMTILGGKVVWEKGLPKNQKDVL